MEKIGLNNYEAWFLDYSEGTLSPSQIEEVNRFVELHPELKQELEDFEAVLLESAEEVKVGKLFKNNLIREEGTGVSRSDYLMIAEVENTISTKEKAELSELVSSNPNLLNDLALYHKTKLPVDEAVVFPAKDALIQKERKVIAWWTYISTAAAAAVLAFVFWNANSTEQVYNPRSFAWQENQPLQQESLTTGIVSTKEVDLGEAIRTKKASPVMNQLADQTKPASPKTIEQIKKEEPLKLEVEAPVSQLAEVPKKSEVEEPNSSSPAEPKPEFAMAQTKPVPVKKEYVPIGEFAKDKVKKDLLKGKTFTETVLEEIAEISNDKITLKVDQKKEGLFESFALNLGKLSISRNR